ncbi:MAG: hypothetical protein IPK02_20745 [Candidatus Accumulibacter sp.]|uniref:Calx-beta domain-containing protein n=1 Tax=Candidatus Accumulibacter affinis TaxID=2954384 RepID=A0A935TAR9_9PROT|nr:hypothetical protein [Candidatus Accumulibacter affinis]
MAGDTAVESNERFNVTLSSATNATLGTTSDYGAINNDDVAAAPVISISSTAANTIKNEGNSGSTPFTFTVSRNSGTGASTVRYAVTGVADEYARGGQRQRLRGRRVTHGHDQLCRRRDQQDPDHQRGGRHGGGVKRALQRHPVQSDQRHLGTTSDYGAINNDVAAAPVISISSTAANTIKNEGNSGSTPFTFTVSRNSGTGASTVRYAVTGVADSTRAAASASDFVGGVLPTGTISFAAGETSKTLTINVAGDTAVESNERFNVTLSSATNATLGTTSDYGAINNDDVAAAPVISISSTAANTIKNEGNSGSTPFTFTVSRNSGTGASTVRYAVTGVADSTRAAASASDFVGGVLPTGTISFAAGETSKTLTINVAGDTAVESNERFNVTLSSATNATLGTTSDYGAINNDDVAAAPVISISSTAANTIKNEGNSGSTPFTFTVSRNSGTGASTVRYAVTGVADSTRAAASASDFVGGVLPTGTISFAAGETSKTLTINVAGDTAVESNERFNVTLSSPTNATLGTTSDYGAINNDDVAAAPVISISSTAANTIKNEGNSGSTPFTFTVSRNSGTGASTVRYAVTGVADSTRGGQRQRLRGRRVTHGHDQLCRRRDQQDPDHQRGGRHGGGVKRALQRHPVQRDQRHPGHDLRLWRHQQRRRGRRTGHQHQFHGCKHHQERRQQRQHTLYLHGQPQQRDGRFDGALRRNRRGGQRRAAASASDFVDGVLPTNTISFAAGETSKTLTINVAGDTAVESNERFNVTLSSATNATLGTTSDYGAINNDDVAAAPVISISSTAANTIKNEGNSGSTPFTFTVSRNSGTGASTVRYAVTGVADSTRAAASASDFVGGVLPTGTISFAAGETSKTLTINVAGDTAVESNERFNVTLSSATGTTLGTSTDYGVINNDDSNATLRSSAAIFSERDNIHKVLADFSKAAYSLQSWENVRINDVSANADAARVEVLKDWQPLTLSSVSLSRSPTTSVESGISVKNFYEGGYYTNGNAAALVARSSDAIVIAFRGTNDNGDTNRDDQGNNIKPDAVDWGLPGGQGGNKADHWAMLRILLLL